MKILACAAVAALLVVPLASGAFAAPRGGFQSGGGFPSGGGFQSGGGFGSGGGFSSGGGFRSGGGIRSGGGFRSSGGPPGGIQSGGGFRGTPRGSAPVASSGVGIGPRGGYQRPPGGGAPPPGGSGGSYQGPPGGYGGYRGHPYYGGYRRGYGGSNIVILGPGYYDPFWPYGYYGYYPFGFYSSYAYVPPPRVTGPGDYYPPDYLPPEAGFGPPPEEVWYYCDDPEGYYPYVRTCNNAWQEVPATPEGAAPAAAGPSESEGPPAELPGISRDTARLEGGTD